MFPLTGRCCTLLGCLCNFGAYFCISAFKQRTIFGDNGSLGLHVF